MRLDLVGVRVSTEHNGAEHGVPVTYGLEHGLPKRPGEKLHAAYFIRDHHMSSVHRTPDGGNPDPFEFFEIHAVLRDTYRSWMTCGCKQRNIPLKGYDAESFSRAARAKVLCIKAGSTHSHGADNLPNECRFSDARLSGDEVCCLHA